MQISIVIPNYNHARYLAKAINRALAQTTPADEILIIDDGSTDNSLEIIKDFSTNHPKIKYLQNPQNQGVIYTINRALQAAQGSHVLIAAADDWIEPTLLQTATQLLDQYPQCGFWSCGSWVVDGDLDRKQYPARMRYPQTNGYINPTQAREYLTKIDSWFMGNTVILNRKLALEEGGFDPLLKSFCDNFLYRVLALKYGCCFSPQKLGTWRKAQHGFAHKLNIDANAQIAVRDHVINLTANKYTDIFSKQMAQHLSRRLDFVLANSMWQQSAGHLNAQLREFIQQSNIKYAALLVYMLQLLSCIPIIGQRLGQVLLFVALRPFDLKQQLSPLAR